MASGEELAPRVEQYSIDEMFIDVSSIDASVPFEDFGRQLRTHVRACSGLTIGVSFGISKTLLALGIRMAPDLARTCPSFLRKTFSVMLETDAPCITAAICAFFLSEDTSERRNMIPLAH